MTIPGKILSIKNGEAEVKNGSRRARISLGVVFDAKVGDWLLYATDRAVRKISASDAREIIELLEDNYQPVKIEALPLRYKKIIYKIRNPKHEIRNKSQISKLSDAPVGVRHPVAGSSDKSQNYISKVKSDLSQLDIEYLLNIKDRNNLEAMYAEANVLRKERLEDFVCIHGIIEFSNYCRNNCFYCGIRRDSSVKRYRMTLDEIYRVAKKAVEEEGYKLIVLQSGEDFSYSDEEMVEMVKRIKRGMRVFIFLSVGERSKDFYKAAFEAGASGSLFRFETSNPILYESLHPGHNLRERLASLENQLKIGYYMASGGLIGLPGQTIADMAQDLMLVRNYQIPMLSSGPWLPAAKTPLLNLKSQTSNLKSTSQNSNFIDNGEKLRLTLNYIAVARLMMPEIKIPVTTALETLDPESGRHRGLLAGANALMFNITPKRYRADYKLYDHKYIEREKVWQKYGLFKGEESYEMLEKRLQI